MFFFLSISLSFFCVFRILHSLKWSPKKKNQIEENVMKIRSLCGSCRLYYAYQIASKHWHTWNNTWRLWTVDMRTWVQLERGNWQWIDSRQYGMDSRFAIYLRGWIQDCWSICSLCVRVKLSKTKFSNNSSSNVLDSFRTEASHRIKSREKRKRAEICCYIWKRWWKERENNEIENMYTICNYYFDHLT